MATVEEIVSDKCSAPISAWAAESIARIRAMAPAELQQYAESPPGEDWGVIYVGVNIFNGKPYVGLHSHGKGGQSAYRVRWKKHAIGKEYTKFKNGMKKWGHLAFVWLILDRVPCCFLADTEIATIAKLDSIKNGYNTSVGGAGTPRLISGLEAIRAANRDPEKRQKQRDIALDKWKDPSFKERQTASRKRAWTKPERKEAASTAQKALWTPEHRAMMSAKRVVSNAQPETKKKIGDASKRAWEAEGHHEKMCQIRQEAYKGEAGAARKDAASGWFKKMWKGDEYRDKKTKEINVWRNSDSVRAQRRATILKKREVTLSKCTTESERKKKIRQWKKTDNLQVRTFAAAGIKRV